MSSTRKLTKCAMCDSLMGMATTTGVCTDCWDEDEKLFQKVSSVLNFGQRVLPEELSQKAGVDIKHVQRWMDQGRFG